MEDYVKRVASQVSYDKVHQFLRNYKKPNPDQSLIKLDAGNASGTLPNGAQVTTRIVGNSHPASTDAAVKIDENNYAVLTRRETFLGDDAEGAGLLLLRHKNTNKIFIQTSENQDLYEIDLSSFTDLPASSGSMAFTNNVSAFAYAVSPSPPFGIVIPNPMLFGVFSQDSAHVCVASVLRESSTYQDFKGLDQLKIQYKILKNFTLTTDDDDNNIVDGEVEEGETIIHASAIHDEVDPGESILGSAQGPCGNTMPLEIYHDFMEWEEVRTTIRFDTGVGLPLSPNLTTNTDGTVSLDFIGSCGITYNRRTFWRVPNDSFSNTTISPPHSHPCNGLEGTVFCTLTTLNECEFTWGSKCELPSGVGGVYDPRDGLYYGISGTSHIVLIDSISDCTFPPADDCGVLNVDNSSTYCINPLGGYPNNLSVSRDMDDNFIEKTALFSLKNINSDNVQVDSIQDPDYFYVPSLATTVDGTVDGFLVTTNKPVFRTADGATAMSAFSYDAAANVQFGGTTYLAPNGSSPLPETPSGSYNGQPAIAITNVGIVSVRPPGSDPNPWEEINYVKGIESTRFLGFFTNRQVAADDEAEFFIQSYSFDQETVQVTEESKFEGFVDLTNYKIIDIGLVE